MLNMIKMELYRMFRSKSMYVIWIVMTLMLLFTTLIAKEDYELSKEMPAAQQEELAQDSDEDSGQNTNLGMDISLTTKPGERISVFDLFYANTQGKLTALFMVIFAVLFTTADTNSGYIKNIGGQVRNRGLLIPAKAVALLVFTVITLLMNLLIQTIFSFFCFGFMELGNIQTILLYLGIQLPLHFAIVLICMTASIIFRSNVLSMVFAICLSLNLVNVIYGLIDLAINKIGIKNFQLYQYTVSGRIYLLPPDPGRNDCLVSLAVAAGFTIGTLLIGSTIFKKRDI